MKDFLVLGSATGTVYQPDAVSDFAAGAESGVRLAAQTRPLLFPDPANGLPFSEAEFKRVLVKVTHRSGCALYVTPLLEGAPVASLRRYFSRPAPPQRETITFTLSLFRSSASAPQIRKGLRGNSLAVLIEAYDPAGRFHVESIAVGYVPLHEMPGAVG